MADINAIDAKIISDTKEENAIGASWFVAKTLNIAANKYTRPAHDIH